MRNGVLYLKCMYSILMTPHRYFPSPEDPWNFGVFKVVKLIVEIGLLDKLVRMAIGILLRSGNECINTGHFNGNVSLK